DPQRAGVAKQIKETCVHVVPAYSSAFGTVVNGVGKMNSVSNVQRTVDEKRLQLSVSIQKGPLPEDCALGL
ncbi:hypothetical protein PHLCEN_2v6245, partial [Hermanssonia centrifuga]